MRPGPLQCQEPTTVDNAPTAIDTSKAPLYAPTIKPRPDGVLLWPTTSALLENAATSADLLFINLRSSSMLGTARSSLDGTG